MNNLTFAPAATSDINQIWDYTAEQWGVVFFRKLDAGIEVIRILHQSMDFERHL